MCDLGGSAPEMPQIAVASPPSDTKDPAAENAARLRRQLMAQRNSRQSLVIGNSPNPANLGTGLAVPIR